jgi:D-allose transport system substrate-binding protein
MKKLLSLLLVAMMAMAMVACSTQPATTEEPAAAEEPAASTETAEEPAEEETAEEPAAEAYCIGVLMKTLASPYWQSMAAGLEEEVAKMDDVTIEIFGAESEDDLSGQLALMENMINSGKYDALCVAPITPTNLISGVVMANQMGLPVVDIDEKFDMDALKEAGGYVVGYATSDNNAVGAMAADLIAEAYPDGAGVCIIEGIAGATSGELRRDGCINALAEMTGYTVLDVQPGDWDRQVALDVATNMINKYGDELKAIFTANDTMAKGALQAMENTGRTDILLVSTDADTEVQEAIAAGKLVAVVQNPTGIAVSCVEQAIEAVKSGNAGSLDAVVEDTLIPAKVYNQDNISELLG